METKTKTKIQRSRLRELLRRYVSLITPDRLPVPSNGDCWDCLFRDKDGRCLGDLMPESTHLISHLRSGYLFGSILVNSMRENGYTDDQIRTAYKEKDYVRFRRNVARYIMKRLW
jgi:hypothetical protein